GTDKKVWWLCSAGHAWQASVGERSRGKGCPYCCGRLVCSDNCLETLNPSLAKEWHPTKNGSLTPKEVTPGSNKKVWWLCQNGHEWQARIQDRNRGKGCMLCYRKRKNNIKQTVA
ncbi:zinc-ribbon domain-containing protein, partial [candidate division WOR-3 bacterium]|nr:zinc-ribbon domain-containing protein [candidate division WOR-3 bacterium]